MKKFIIITVLLIILCCIGIEVYQKYVKVDNTKVEENEIEKEESTYETEEIMASAGGESFWYEKALKYKENNKYGLMGLDGTKYTEAEFDKIEALNYREGYIVLTKNNKSKVVKLKDNRCEDFTVYYDEVGVLGADYDIKDDEIKYIGGESDYIVGVNNGKREQYYEIKPDDEDEKTSTSKEETKKSEPEKTYMEGYEVLGTISIPKTKCKYPILDNWTLRVSQIAIGRLGIQNELNGTKNVTLAGNNNKNGTFFSDNKKLEIGDVIYITDQKGESLEYEIYKKYTTTQNDVEFMMRDTGGKPEITLYTENYDDPNNTKLIIYAKVKE